MVASTADLQTAADLLGRILSEVTGSALGIAAESHSAVSAFDSAEYSRAAVAAFAAAEALLARIWVDEADYVDPEVPRFERAEKGFAADRISVLVECGFLDQQVGGAIDSLRKSRNGWAHRLEEADISVVTEGLNNTAALFFQVFKVLIGVAFRRPDFGYSPGAHVSRG